MVWPVNVGCDVHDAANGRLLTAWSGHNVICNGARSAFADIMVHTYVYAEGATARIPRFFQFGSGSAPPAAGDTALQYRLTGKATGAGSAIGASGFTARLYCTLGSNELADTAIRELLLSRFTAPAAGDLVFAHALVNGGTGISHKSGALATFYWDFVLGTGQQPF